MPAPTYSKDDPVWTAHICLDDVRIEKPQFDYRHGILVDNVTLEVAQQAIERYLEAHYPGDWYDVEIGTTPYYGLRSKFISANPGRIQLNRRAAWVIRAYGERLKDKTQEMYALLQELAPNDERVKAIVEYIETSPE